MNTFTCPHCGQSHPVGAKFCPVMGKPITQPSASESLEMMSCPKCGRMVNKAKNFCPFCGETIISNASMTQERHRITSSRAFSKKLILTIISLLIISSILVVGLIIGVNFFQPDDNLNKEQAIVPTQQPSKIVDGTEMPLLTPIPTTTNSPKPVKITTFTSTPSNSPTISPVSTKTSTPIPTHAPSLTRQPTITPISQRTSPTVVLWDLTHGPRQGQDGVYSPAGVFSNLKSSLSNYGISMVGSQENLTQVDLSKYGVVVVAMLSVYKNDISASEAAHVVEFVREGGGLLILAEEPGVVNHIQELLRYFDVDVCQQPALETINNLEDHLITRDVKQIKFFFGGGALHVNSNLAQVVASQAGAAAVAVINYERGRVVIIGDTNLFDNRGLKDNQQFALNVFRWLISIGE